MVDPAPGGAFGRYEIVGEPAYYGAGSVVAAREARTGAPRTLWLVLPHVVAEAGQRDAVVRVATALRRLESPHLVRLHEFGTVEGQPFFATAPIDGVDLGRVCAPDGIPPEDALDLIAQIGTGLNHLHHAGIVDGALGPRRVVLEERDGSVTVRVREPGLLGALLPTSALFGTQKQEALDFGAPELHHGGVPTVRSDVYSLGCLLWLALTGEAPFTSYVGHRSGPVPQVAGDGPCEEALNSILQRALAKDPADRYRDAAAFVATVRSVATLAREGLIGELPERVVPRRDRETPTLADALYADPAAEAPVEEPAPRDEADVHAQAVARALAADAAHREPAPLRAPAHQGQWADEVSPVAGSTPVATSHAHVAHVAHAPDVDDIPTGDEAVLARLGASFEPLRGGETALDRADRSSLAEATAGWAPITDLRPPDAPEQPQDAAVPTAASSADAPAAAGDASDTTDPVRSDHAIHAAAEHWASGGSVVRLRRHGKKRGAARLGLVAAGLGAIAVVTVWGARHYDLLGDEAAPTSQKGLPGGTAPSSPSASPSASPSLDPLGQLFPIKARGDCTADEQEAAHRIERWTCQREGYRVVLTHWDSLASARELVPHGGDAGKREKWRIDGHRAGTQWTWRSPDGVRPFRWTAIYRDVPYAVIIEAKSADRRHAARTSVAIHPSTALG